ncbi:hypothetical protein MAR_021548 [Mya arenaria]|uniref:Ig-like domain-containing protein n=1 Tax=Mya arenaria TaxID=6604 RepID=A0ABY7EAI8_MYAAR|nr:hypothetical protein MAR_021548 [Mya arenaria]
MTSSCLTDIGLFTCVSANKHNRSPRYPTDYNHDTTIDTRPGEKAILNFSVFSNPPPIQFTWTNISNYMHIPIVSSASDRVIINSTDGMSSSLIITSVEPWDSGYYSVRVQNEIGSLIETFLVFVDINTDPASEPSTVANSDSGTERVVGDTVGAVCTVIIVAVLLAIFLYRKRQKRNGEYTILH